MIITKFESSNRSKTNPRSRSFLASYNKIELKKWIQSKSIKKVRESTKCHLSADSSGRQIEHGVLVQIRHRGAVRALDVIRRDL